MAQGTAADTTAPRAWLVYAWLDPLLHPKFATFQCWFPLMKPGWRRITLAVTLVLICIEGVIRVATYPVINRHDLQSLEPQRISANLLSPREAFLVAYWVAGSAIVLFTIPALVALVSAWSLGPYVIRFKRIYRPWIQVQPIICMLLLFSTVAHTMLIEFGMYQSENLFFNTLSLLLVPVPALATWSYSLVALSAGSSRTKFQAGLVAAIPGILFWLTPLMFGFSGF